MINRYNNWLLVLFFLSLPFERLLTLEVAGYTVKLSYVLAVVLITSYLYSLVIASRRRGNPSTSLRTGLPVSKIASSPALFEKGLGPRNDAFKIRKEEKYLLLFVLTSYLTTFWSIDQKRTLVISSALLLMALVFIVVRRLVNGENREKFENIIIWLGVGTSVFALWQFLAGNIPSLNSLSFLRPQYQSGIFGFPRVQSTFLEPQYFANFLILPLFLAVRNLISLETSDRWIPAFAGMTKREAGMTRGGYIKLGLISLGFFLTLSRGAEYALIIALLVLAFIVYITDRVKLKAYGLAIITIIVGALIGTLMILAVAGKTGVKNYFGHATTTNLTTNEGTTDRGSTSEVAYGIFLSNPMGIGSGAFGALPIYKDQIPDKGYQIVNNEYLEILAEDGILGMLFFGLFIIGLIVYLIREIKNGRKEAAFLLAAVIAILIQYLVFSTLYFAYFWVFLAFVWPADRTGKQLS